MATTIYTGAAADGDWENDTNWSNGVPATADNVRISSDATTNLTTNLNQSDHDTNNGLNLESFIIEKDCPIDIGGTANPLVMTVGNSSDAYLLHKGTGALYWNNDEGSAAPGYQTYKAILDGSAASATINYTADLTLDYLDILLGSFYANEDTTSVTISQVAIEPRTLSANARLVCQGDAVGYPLVRNNGGVIDSTDSGYPTTVVQFAGYWDTGDQPAEPTLYLMGGVVDWGLSETAVSTAGIVHLMGGTLLFEKYDGAAFKAIYHHPRGSFDFARWNALRLTGGSYSWETSSPIGYIPVGSPNIGTN